MEAIGYQKGCGNGMNIKGMTQLRKTLQSLPDQVDAMVKKTLMDFAQRIFNEAMSNLPAGATAIRSTYRIETRNGGMSVSIITDNEIAAYIEFGTGRYAASYLSGQPQEVKDEAIKFFVNGEGTMQARPYLFPAYYKYREALLIELNKQLSRIVK